jgi:hypothetical protein
VAKPNTAKSPPEQTSAQRIAGFQTEITEALEAGVPAEGMTLRLTLRDEANLRRDPAVPVAALRFDQGQMLLLGVKVTGGGVNSSELARPQA